jgi:hypothetical protein
MYLHNACDSLQKIAVETAVIFFERHNDKPGAVAKHEVLIAAKQYCKRNI